MPKKSSAGNFSNLPPYPFYAFLTCSHPLLPQCMRAIQQYEGSGDGHSVSYYVASLCRRYHTL